MVTVARCAHIIKIEYGREYKKLDNEEDFRELMAALEIPVYKDFGHLCLPSEDVERVLKSLYTFNTLADMWEYNVFNACKKIGISIQELTQIFEEMLDEMDKDYSDIYVSFEE